MVEIIAEIGKNFVTTSEEEDMTMLLTRARLLIAEAKRCGVDTVKFQIHQFEDEVLPISQRYEWVKRNTYPIDFWWKIKEFCRKLEINFLVTPMSRGAAIMMNEDIGIDRWKVGSGDILDFVMLDYIRDSGKPVILSSGMSTLEELEKSYNFLREKTKDISILHCVSMYPCPLECLNLATIPFLKEKFPDAKIGFSDHYNGIESSLMAVSCGAKIIEKHFTLSRNAWGPDHMLSLNSYELGLLVRSIRENNLLGVGTEVFGVQTKYVRQEEVKLRSIFHKGLYASRNIKKDTLITSEELISLRPKIETSEPSENYVSFLGKFIQADTLKYEPINNSLFK